MSTTKEAVWLRTGALCKALGISESTLFRREQDGFLKEKIHFIRSGPSKSHMKLWDLKKCQQVFGTWRAPKGGAE